MGLSGGMRQVWSAAVAMVLVAAACASAQEPVEPLVETSTAGDDVTADLRSQLLIPDPSLLIIDEDPDSPIAATVLFEEGDHPVEKLDFLGPKPATNRPPTTALVYLKNSDDVFQIDLDAEGRPSVMYLADVGELRFSFAATTMSVEFVAPDGSTSTESFALTGDADEGAQSMEVPPGDRNVSVKRAMARKAAVDVNRAVFLDVSVWTPDGELPGELGAPFLQADGCSTARSTVTFDCDRVGARIVESRDDIRVYRLAMTHTARALVEGLDASIWPSAQACEAALGNDWWTEAPLSAGLEVSSTALGTKLLSWFASNPQMAAGGAAVGATFLAAVAISAAVAFSFWGGNWVGDQIVEGGEGNCDRIKRRVVAMNMLGATVGDIAFTVEVCLPPIEGWAVEPRCQDVGPYQPFSTEMQTMTADAGTLDRNRLPSVEFIITPTPGSITGTVVDAETGDSVSGAVVTVGPDGFETVTDTTGRFTFTEVPVGARTIEVTADGFTDTTAQVEVETDQTSRTTITLERSDDLPWVFEGTGVKRTVFSRYYGGQSNVTIEREFDMRITLNADGSIEYLEYPPEGQERTIYNCVTGEFQPNPDQTPFPVIQFSGTHGDGTFTVVTRGTLTYGGTYSASAIEGGYELTNTFELCDGSESPITMSLFFRIPRASLVTVP